MNFQSSSFHRCRKSYSGHSQIDERAEKDEQTFRAFDGRGIESRVSIDRTGARDGER